MEPLDLHKPLFQPHLQLFLDFSRHSHENTGGYLFSPLDLYLKSALALLDPTDGPRSTDHANMSVAAYTLMRENLLLSRSPNPRAASRH